VKKRHAVNMKDISLNLILSSLIITITKKYLNMKIKNSPKTEKKNVTFLTTDDLKKRKGKNNYIMIP
jgi:hypothetical protein